MKTTTRMMTTVIALLAMTMMMGACRSGPYEPDYTQGEEAVMRNQPFTPHSIGR